MKKWKQLWQNEVKDLLPYEKKFRVAALILLAVLALVFVLEILLSCDLDLLVKTVMILAMMSFAVSGWRQQRGTAIFCIIATAGNTIIMIYKIVNLLS